MELNEILLEARQKAHLSQQEVADKFSYSVQVISKWENNLSSPPLDLLVKIANLYMIDLSSFIDGEIKSIDSIYKEKFDLDKFSLRFKMVRMNLKISLKDMGDKLERSKSFMIRLEKSDTMPNISFFVDYVKTYKLNVYDTYFGHELVKKEKLSKAIKGSIIALVALFTIALSLSIARFVIELNDNGQTNLPITPDPDDEGSSILEPIDFSDSFFPEEFTKVNITQSEALALRYEDINIVRSKIQTFGDLLTFFKFNEYLVNDPLSTYLDLDTNLTWYYGKNYMSVFKNGYGNGYSFANLTRFLLSDDYKDNGYLNVLYYTDYGLATIYNYFKIENKYYLFNIEDIIQCVYKDCFRVINTDSLETASKSLSNNNTYISLIFTGFYTDGYLIPFSFNEDSEYIGLIPEGLDYNLLFNNNEGLLSSLQERKLDYSFNSFGSPIIYKSIKDIENEDIGFKEILGKPTLNDSSLSKLIYEEDIKVLKDKITNLCDLLYYFYSRSTGFLNRSMVYNFDNNNYTISLDAQSLVFANEGTPGTISNFARYVLSDNYVEFGFINYIYSFTHEFNYVANYIKKNNTYYIFELTSWVASNKPSKYIESDFNSLKDYCDSRWFSNSHDIRELIAYNNLDMEVALSNTNIENKFITINDKIDINYLFLDDTYSLNKVSFSQADEDRISFLRKLY